MSLPSPAPDSAALVTGASSGLGVELARALARRGHNLILVARRTQLLEELAAELEVRAECLTCDLGDPAARAALLKDIEALGLDVDILVNNAGLGTAGSFQHSDVEVQQTIVRVNVEAMVGLTGALLPAMVERGRGGVLNVGSTTGFQPVPNNATYSATKAFVLSWTESLHTELSGTGVTATVVCPGPVKTEIWAGDKESAAADRLPGIMWKDADTVAEAGLDGLDAGKRVVIPGAINRVGALYGQHTPRAALLRIVRVLGRD
jgi:short-subunit dehydrogenase